MSEWIKTSEQMPEPATSVLGLYLENQGLMPAGVCICGYGPRSRETSEVSYDFGFDGQKRWWSISTNEMGGGNPPPTYWMPCPEYSHLLELSPKQIRVYEMLWDEFKGTIINPDEVVDEEPIRPRRRQRRRCTGLPD